MPPVEANVDALDDSVSEGVLPEETVTEPVDAIGGEDEVEHEDEQERAGHGEVEEIGEDESSVSSFLSKARILGPLACLAKAYAGSS